MNLKNSILRIILLILCLIGFSVVFAQDSENKESNMTDKKVLVVFFSRAGENYSVGNVKVGNTQIIANMISKRLSADMFQIIPVHPYPEDYTECTKVAQNELAEEVRPSYVGDTDISGYDVVFIGYPNWWGDAPMPVYTFIENHDWEGKTVYPFCTHEGSGLSNLKEISSACKGASVKQGIGIYGHVAQNETEKAKQIVSNWLDKIKF